MPHDKHVHADDFDFYLDLLATTADTVGSEHTLKMKGGAFWNMFGSMQEILIPVFVLINVVMKAYHKKHDALAEKLKNMVLNKAKAYMKLCGGPNPPKPCESYHPTLLGHASMDSRGHLPLETFLKEALLVFKSQRAEDALGLNTVFQTWDSEHNAGFDAFQAMLQHAKPDIADRDVIELYSAATVDDDERVHMEHIECALRKKRVVLKVKPGMNRRGTTPHLDAVGLAAKTVSLFASAPSATTAAAAVAARGRRGSQGVSPADLAAAASQFAQEKEEAAETAPSAGLARWQAVSKTMGNIARIRELYADVCEARGPGEESQS